MKEELHALIAVLEEHNGGALDGLLDRARALDTLDEEQLTRAVSMTRESLDRTASSRPFSGEDGRLAAVVLELLNEEEESDADTE